VLLTCTFNAASSRLGPTSPAALADLARRAVSLARSAPTTPGPARSALRVAGGLGPVALARPGGPAPGPAALRAPVAAAARALADAGVDLLWLESQYDGREAEAALEAALPLGLPVVITFTLEARGGRLVAPGGGLAEPLLLAAAHQGAAAVGVNCVAAGPALTALAAWAAASLGVPFVAKPSAGLPGALLPPAAFAEALAPALRAGARLVGGCCGAGPGHVEALAARLRDEGFG
jgi:5-methyltetrahydrofolate--homocysteine methyltransferase